MRESAGSRWLRSRCRESAVECVDQVVCFVEFGAEPTALPVAPVRQPMFSTLGLFETLRYLLDMAPQLGAEPISLGDIVDIGHRVHGRTIATAVHHS